VILPDQVEDSLDIVVFLDVVDMVRRQTDDPGGSALQLSDPFA
jgi:hypothetical protein